MKRRTFLGSMAASLAGGLTKPLAALGKLVQPKSLDKPRVVVIGAGAFGGWTALYLLRKGARVTLLDALGPGHPWASSGGESRVIRRGYAESVYVDLAGRALQLWREHNQRWHKPLFHPTGILWMSNGHPFLEAVVKQFQTLHIPHERLDMATLTRRYPQINPEGLSNAVWEPEGGYLLANRACAAVVAGFQSEGGEYRTERALPGRIHAGRMENVLLGNGESLNAERYVFACGPWLGKLFPDLLAAHLKVTRQEVFDFDTALAGSAYDEGQLPIWADLRDKLWYGIPGRASGDYAQHGFKVADDTRGPVFNPDGGARTSSDAGLKSARAFMATRFPAMNHAPLVASRVCQYTNTPDQNFIVDTHPEAANVWIMGGGSGHGFKHGPALGERAAGWVLGEGAPEPLFSLARFSKP